MPNLQQARSEIRIGKYILIVEDDPMLGNLILEVLQDEEIYQGVHVLSGEMALDMLQKDAPALMILDYHLPGMNGLELADWLGDREDYKHIPLILMSANVPHSANGKDRLRILKKPFELDVLLHMVTELLAKG